MNNALNQSAHIDSQSSILAAMDVWEVYLLDQGRSEYTVKSLSRRHPSADQIPATLIRKSAISPPTTSTTSLNGWKMARRARTFPCSPKSLARRITSLKSFFRWLAEAWPHQPRSGRSHPAAFRHQPPARSPDCAGNRAWCWKPRAPWRKAHRPGYAILTRY